MPKISSVDTNTDRKSRIYKAIETWFLKIYLNKVTYNAKNKYFFIDITNCLSFILSIYGKTEEDKNKMTPAIISHAKKTKNTFIAKLKRTKKHPSIIELQAKYPKLDIVSAYQFLMLKNKFKATKSEIQDFETLINILSKNTQKTKK